MNRLFRTELLEQSKFEKYVHSYLSRFTTYEFQSDLAHFQIQSKILVVPAGI